MQMIARPTERMNMSVRDMQHLGCDIVQSSDPKNIRTMPRDDCREIPRGSEHSEVSTRKMWRARAMQFEGGLPSAVIGMRIFDN